MKVIVKRGNYFGYPKKYHVEFQYDNKEEQDHMYHLFDDVLLQSYGINTIRDSQGMECIKPYMVDERGKFSTKNTGIIGGTNIPEDLLPTFISRFVEADGATVKIGDGEIKGDFDYNEYYDLISKLRLQMRLKKGQYFGYGERYFVEFQYGSKEQQENVFHKFSEDFIPAYVSHSYRREIGEEYIIPYFVDEQGNMTTENTGIIGGTSIPLDLVPYFIRSFMEQYDATLKAGDNTTITSYDYNEFDKILAKVNQRKTM